MPETTKKPKAAKKPADHPTFAVMIAAAIAELKERKGSSRQAIEKYVAANYKVGPKYTGPLKQALKKGVEKSWISVSNNSLCSSQIFVLIKDSSLS